MSKKVKQNTFKPAPPVPAPVRLKKAGQRAYRLLSLPVLLCVFSLVAIYAHDAVVQSPFFYIESVEVSGGKRVDRREIMTLADLARPRNIFEVNLYSLERRIVSHPWIAAATVRRDLFATLTVDVVEEEPLAIVAIENLSDILINAQGKPFKEYDPKTDQVAGLPVISGVDLSLAPHPPGGREQYRFDGPLFNSILDLLHTPVKDRIFSITGDETVGVTVHMPRIPHQPNPDGPSQVPVPDTRMSGPAPLALLPVTLGFGDFTKKLDRVLQISQYIQANIPGKTISAMDLFDIDKVYVKTADTDTQALHTNLEKGV